MSFEMVKQWCKCGNQAFKREVLRQADLGDAKTSNSQKEKTR
jgi:hypothetical protein